MIQRVLVANRGEIAVRIFRTCRLMGIGTAAVYSAADADAPFVTAADVAIPIGPPPARDSYLNIPKIIDAARRARADAVHPGYGFLSENASFARACEDAGLTFIGPPSGVIALMGSKTSARATVAAAGVPVVPGAIPDAQTDEAIAAAVEQVGFPALLKAASGGGGKGMRVVRAASEVLEAIRAARREAERSFGRGALYVERLIEHARHIEVQVLADTHGTVVHLFERDCTLQRRHQKVIEEAPAPTLAPGVRARITRAAVDAARAAGYVNAGTVECLLQGDGEAAQFYFLEMNTRLQVEHPVTEAITGIDLVEAQLRIASGEPLPFSQADIHASGHAVECRVYAEDSTRLLPQSGRLIRYREPTSRPPSGQSVRIDSGVREGQTITVHYDPMLAKLIAHAPSRLEALEAASKALGEFEILGVHHNIAFLRALLARTEVRTNAIDTHFIEQHLELLAGAPPVEVRNAAAAVAARLAARGPASTQVEHDKAGVTDPWETIGPMAW